MSKFITHTKTAAKVKDGITAMIGGFLGQGTTENIHTPHILWII
ncbi:MAG: hypothetical protein ACOYEG_06000 [Petrimonas sp.]|jgi:acyl CoA:acetate/3-ketoacid CoA transferase alpha subunit